MTHQFNAASSHVTGEPPILYFGTPVVLISTLNEVGSANLAPMSSIFWLGWRCMIGMATASKTTGNMLRTGQCVLNLPSADQAAAVDRLAMTTGSDPVPGRKAERGYYTDRTKFATAGLTPLPSETMAPPRAAECPVNMEAEVMHSRNLAEDHEIVGQFTTVLELRIRRVHLHREILFDGSPDRVDPDKWRPLIMSFAKFYGLADGQLHPSRLASIPEAFYRSPEVDEARLIMA
jgi:flavin reductase (DIM6/NTAB) family NADH-FMN oxidoreductase RutF